MKIPLRCTTKHKKEVVFIKVIYFNPNQYEWIKKYRSIF
jgi:hypothetical protein